MKLDLNDPNVFVVNATVDEIRQFAEGGDLPEQVECAMDNAQGDVHSGNSVESYVVIAISK